MWPMYPSLPCLPPPTTRCPLLPSTPQFPTTSEDDRLSFAASSLEMFHTSHPAAAISFHSTCLRSVSSLLSCSDSFQAAVSALYAKLLVILGLALPLAEVLSDNISLDYFNLFYVYLFLVSTLYLLLVYCDLVQVILTCPHPSTHPHPSQPVPRHGPASW